MHYWPTTGGHDADEMISRLYLGRMSILKFKEFPLWSPHMWGGVPSFCLISMVLSPFFLIIIILGEIIGLKILIVTSFILGIWGMYHLARDFGATRITACLAPIMFFFSSIFPLQIAEGTYTYALSLCWVPWLFHFYLKCFINDKHIYSASFMAALIIWGGGTFPVLFFVTGLLFVYSFFECFCRKDLVPFKIFIRIMLISFILGAIHWFPWTELSNKIALFYNFSRYAHYNDIKVLGSALFSRDQLLSTPRDLIWGLPANVSFWEQRGAYIGYVGFILYITGFKQAFKKHRTLALVNIVFLLFASFNVVLKACPVIGDFLPVWVQLYNYPRLIWIFVLTAALIAPLGITQFQKNSSFGNHDIRKGLILCILIVTVSDFILVNRPIFKEAFNTNPVRHDEKTEFHQTQVNPLYENDGMYKTVLQNKGLADENSKVLFRSNVIPRSSPLYNGEAYLTNHHEKSVQIKYFSPHKIVIEVPPKIDDILVINQNFDPNWQVKGTENNETIFYNGLLATHIRGSNEQRIIFHYHSAGFLTGLWFTLLTIALIILYRLNFIKEFQLRTALICLFLLSSAMLLKNTFDSPKDSPYYQSVTLLEKGSVCLRNRNYSAARFYLEAATDFFPYSISLRQKLSEVYKSLNLHKKYLKEKNMIELLSPSI